MCDTYENDFGKKRTMHILKNIYRGLVNLGTSCSYHDNLEYFKIVSDCGGPGWLMGQR